MPMIREYLDDLNRNFDSKGIKATAKQADKFAPGRKLDFRFLFKKDATLARVFQSYVDQAPGSLREGLRSVIYYALTQSPPSPINFAWEPSYDSQLTVWEVDCGISVNWQVPARAEPRGRKKA
jgi:hypothetical protein